MSRSADYGILQNVGIYLALPHTEASNENSEFNFGATGDVERAHAAPNGVLAINSTILQVAVWKQKNDAGIEYYSVKLDRR